MRFFCFKQLSLNDKLELESPYQLIDGERLLPVVVGVVISYMIQLFVYRQGFLKHNKAFELLSKVVLDH